MTWYEIFLKVLNMNLTASVVIVFVLILRLLFKRVPKIYSYVLWSVVLFRLLCPISLSAPISILGVFDAPIVERTADANRTEMVQTSMLEYIPSDIVHEEYPAVNLPAPMMGDIISEAVNEKSPQGWVQTTFEPLEVQINVVTYLWLFGTISMLGYGMVSYFKMRLSLVGAMQLRDNVYLADHIQSPFVMGILLPRIYLPSDLEEQEQRYIILHEQLHIRRGDPMVKMMAFIALCIHWFNPLVWIAFLLSAKDMEMSCDEAVIKKLGEDIRVDYSTSLLQMAIGQRSLFGTQLSFGEGEPVGRIRNLARFKKPTVAVTILAAFICVAGILLCVFNPSSSYDSLKIVEQDTAVGENDAQYEVELENQVESAVNVEETTDSWGPDAVKVWMEYFGKYYNNNVYYVSALQKLEIAGVLPDGKDAYVSEGEVFGNSVAFQDVDMDSRKELLLNIAGTCMADMGLYVYQLDEGPGTEYIFRQELAIWPEATFYTNGIVTAMLSHNHGYSANDEFWPFDIYVYDEETDVYDKVWAVDAWEKWLKEVDYEGTVFPDDIDIDGDGMVYRIRVEEPGELILMDRADYEEWFTELIKGAEENKIVWRELPR